MATRDRVVVIVFPYVTIEVPNIGQVPFIGHAGVLLINGGSGLTKYYEYGRYDPPGIGIVRNKAVPNITMDVDGEPNLLELKATFRAITEQSGKKTSINSVSYLTPGKFNNGLTFCQGRLDQNSDPQRQAYDVVLNNCVSFADQTAKTMVDTLTQMAGMPIFNPIPHTYILSAQFSSLPIPDAHNFNYDYMTDTLV